MELYDASEYFILQNGNNSLWCNKVTGKLEAKPGGELLNAWNPVCLGIVYGIIGKIKVLPDSDWRLLVIKQQELVTKYQNVHDVYRINKIAMLTLNSKSAPLDLDLTPCKQHHYGMSKPKQISQQGRHLLQSTLNSIKSVKDNMQQKKPSKKDPQKERDRLEKRILEELLKMFNVSDFYYYSPTGDITNSIQRQNLQTYDNGCPLWKRADDRFFWNKALLDDLISANNSLADAWIQPIIQGYVGSASCDMAETSHYSSSMFHENVFKFHLTLISRRSRHRAGTRYKRRGVDASGDCANYVETEQILGFQEHLVSYVQVRGSIPVFWSQPGHRYRPPPILDKGEKETEAAFRIHFEQQLSLYKHVTCISLVERQGREKVMADAFLHQIVLYNSPSIAYVAFDFHEYCRGMQFDNVVMLTDAVMDVLRAHKYCWVDTKGMICEQKGIFRVNCIDCLDRTNVVQTAVARIVIDQQVRKLGLLPPDNELSEHVKQSFNQLWANNGDSISRQYAGTAAMKGDYTRTGERKFSGLMKDGVKSANRYLIHRFKDFYRQAAIDIQLGQPLETDILQLLTKGNQEANQDEMDYIRNKASDVVSVIEECRNLLIMEPENYLGGWGVISMDEREDNSDDDMDTILMLTNTSYYIVYYDDETDSLTHYHKISLEHLYAIDIGAAAAASVFRSKQQCIRLWYRYYGEAGYFHTFRVPNVRAFNNAVIEIEGEEEVKEILRSIADVFKIACHESQGLVNIRETRLEQKRFRQVARISIHTQSLESSMWNQPQKIASLATSALNKATKNVKKQLKKFNLSPKREKGNLPTQTEENGDDMEMYDDFSDPPDLLADYHIPEDTSSDTVTDVSQGQENHDNICLLPDVPPFSNTLSLKQTCASLGKSSPQLLAYDFMQPNSDPETTTSHPQDSPKFRSSAPETSDELETNATSETSAVSATFMLHSPQMKISFSDEALKQYAVSSTDTDHLSNRSPLSKFKLGLSQVSQLIVNPTASPHSRRRRQILEAQLLDNHMKSKQQFKKLSTKILLL